MRHREGDIEMLSYHFHEQFAREIPAFRGKVLFQNAIDVLNDYRFRGNMGELKNIIRDAYRDTQRDHTR